MAKESNEGVIDLFGKKYHTVGKRIADLGEETNKDYTLITKYDITQYPVVIVTATLTVGTNSDSKFDNPKPKIDIDDDYVPFKKGANKGKRIVDIDVGSLEWIIHESGMSQAIKDYADKVLGEKYIDIEGKVVENQTDNEELPF